MSGHCSSAVALLAAIIRKGVLLYPSVFKGFLDLLIGSPVVFFNRESQAQVCELKPRYRLAVLLLKGESWQWRPL